MDFVIQVEVRGLPPVVEDGVRGWLDDDRRFVAVGAGTAADVVVRDPIYDRAPVVPRERVVAFSPVTTAEAADELVACGVRAVVAQSRHRRHLLEVIAAVAVGDTRPRPGGPGLSDREQLALVWWLRSMTKASVARQMGISPHTVDMYIKRVRAKYAAAGYSLPTKADLLVRALEDGLVQPEDVLTRPVTDRP